MLKLRLRAIQATLRAAVFVLVSATFLAVSGIAAPMSLQPLLFFSPPVSIAQHPPTPPQPPPDPPPQQPTQPSGTSSEGEISRYAKAPENEVWVPASARYRRERFIHDYYQNLKRDADRIFDLATEFKEYAGNNPGPALTPEMTKKIRKMGDISHDLRKLMYNRKLPRVKNSGVTFLPPDPNAVSGAQNPPPHFLPMANLCLEVATHLRDGMYDQLRSVNTNTVSYSQAQMDLARDIVKTARRIEGLAYELEHKQL
jgi:hypothetical protein